METNSETKTSPKTLSKFDSFKKNAKSIVIKIGQRNLIIICAIVLIGAAVTLNFVLFSNNPDDIGDQQANGLNFDIDKLGQPSSVDSGTGEANGVTAKDPDSDYFVTTVLSRTRARDEAIEVLQMVADSSEALEEIKEKALSDISQIALDIEHEVKIETLIISKGFEQCVAVVNGASANIIVQSEGLLPNEIAQINEIVYEQAGILPANISIIEKSV